MVSKEGCEQRTRDSCAHPADRFWRLDDDIIRTGLNRQFLRHRLLYQSKGLTGGLFSGPPPGSLLIRIEYFGLRKEK